MSNRKKSARKHTFPTRSGTSVSLALRLNVLAGITLIVGAVFLAYLPSISGGFILDDDLLLTDNPNVAAPDGLCLLWCTNKSPEYYPASYTANWIEWRLWGTSPAGYHVTSLILHVAEALLIWIVLRKLSIPGAFLAALIFAVHPVNVESVAWIAQRRNIIAMFFFLLSILWYLKDVLPTSSTGMRLAFPRKTAGTRNQSLPTRHPSLSTLHSPLSTLVLVEPGGIRVGDARQGIGSGHAGAAFRNNLVVGATDDWPAIRGNQANMGGENGTIPFDPAAFIAALAVFRSRHRPDCGKHVVPNVWRGSFYSQSRLCRSSCRGGVRDMVLSLQGAVAARSGVCLSAVAHRGGQIAVVAAACGRAGRYGRAVAA